MRLRSSLMAFREILDEHLTSDGLHATRIPNMYVFRESTPHKVRPHVYQPGVIIGARGTKHIRVGGRSYQHKEGNYFTLMVPMPVECELKEASPENPLTGIGVYLEPHRIADLLVKMDRYDSVPALSDPDPSGIFTAPVTEPIIDASARLLRSLSSPSESAILGGRIIDEIYYRILSEQQGGALRLLLQQRGQIHQISRAVEYVHEHIDEVVSVEHLADIVNMSSSGFHKKFREVMHTSPVQYAKSIKLTRAQALIRDGKGVNEAGYAVGYNSPAQFSREYKRHFGFVPSAT